MPELPEVECIARELRRALTGARVTGASLHRPDVLRADPSEPAAKRRRGRLPRGATAPLLDGVLVAVHRLGKQLALEVDDGRTLVVRLGMSGRLRLRGVEPGAAADESRPVHTHASWTLVSPRRKRGDDGVFELLFVDPRRFGGLAAFDTLDSARRHSWGTLGPDALDLDAEVLRAALHRSRRPIKSLLMDQSVVAGIGNIYADEILHRVGIHPLASAEQCEARAGVLASATRRLLAAAIRCGGSTIRDYVNASGSHGTFQRLHRVYGRAGEECVTCRHRRSSGGSRKHRTVSVIHSFTLSGRTTSFCPCCQTPPASYQQFMHSVRK